MSVKEAEKNVFAWIDEHKDDIVKFCMDYIRHKSPTGKELEVQRDFIKPFFEKEMKFDEIDYFSVAPEVERPNVNGTCKGVGGGKNLLYNGHSDVVDVGPEALKRWTKNPWEPVVEDGKIYGRGANDMKGGNAAMIWATKALMDLGVRLKGDLLVSCVIGEELNQQIWGAIPATKKFQEKGIDIPFCVVTEPTYNEIHTLSAATFDFSITIPGKEVHTSFKNLTQYPQRYGVPVGSEVGVDAIVIMIDLLQRLYKLELQWNLRFTDKIFGGGGYPVPADMQGVGANSINCTLIEGGTYIAAVPGYAKVTGHIFHSPRADPEKLWAEMKEVVNGLAATYDWLKEHPPEIKWKQLFDWPAYEVPVDHPGVKALAEAIKRATGITAAVSGFKAVDDAAYIQRECKVPAVSCGPGNLSMGTHGPDEYVPIDQLIEATKIYAAMAIEWCELAS
jgi:acetylornithine deacetylase